MKNRGAGRRKPRACARAGKRAPTQTTRRGNGAGFGGPAKGYGWGGPASGDGWGGPPRGAGCGKPGQQLRGKPGPGRGHFTIAGEQRAERDEIRREAIMQLYYEIAHNSDASPMLRVNAASKLLDRIEGPPVRRFVAVAADPISLLTDEQLEAEIARLKCRLAIAAVMRGQNGPEVSA